MSPTVASIQADARTTTPVTPAPPSPALQAANARLLALRVAQQVAVSTKTPAPPATAPVVAQPLPGSSLLPTTGDARPAPSHALALLPPHLGWESTPLTAVLRRRRLAPAPADLPQAAAFTARPLIAPGGLMAVASGAAITPTPPDGPDWQPPPTGAIRLQPSLAMAWLRTGQSACGRLWLLLRCLDTEGRGCLPLDRIRTWFTTRASAWRLCGQRQLRSLLRQGDGLFWQRDADQLWLASTARVAARLGVRRLAGHPIALPLAVLLQPIGQVRAHLYASFHSSRQEETGSRARPISRAALTAVSGVSRRTQQAYERRARVQVMPHLAIGPAATDPAAEEAAWQQGRAAFVLVDRRGRQGRAGRAYLAWQMPNSYRGPHVRLGRGRQKRLNRRLVDLCHNGDAGNGQVDGEGFVGQRRYAAHGAAAARLNQGGQTAAIYWPGRRERHWGLWCVW